MVSSLCEQAEISRSGYYAWLWLKAEETPFQCTERDWQDYELIKKVFEEKKALSQACPVKETPLIMP